MNIERALAVEGWLTEAEAAYLASVASRSLTAIEVGAWMGRSTCAIAANIHSRVWAVDTWGGSAEHAPMLAGKPNGWLYERFLANTKGLPAIPLMLRFGRRKGSNGFTSGWVDVWREMTDIAADRWLDQMQADDVIGDLIQSRTVPYRKDDARIAQAKTDMFTILPAMESASVDSPMRRSSCDDPIKGACVWQPLCWSPSPVDIDDLLHLYRTKS